MSLVNKMLNDLEKNQKEKTLKNTQGKESELPPAKPPLSSSKRIIFALIIAAIILTIIVLLIPKDREAITKKAQQVIKHSSTPSSTLPSNPSAPLPPINTATHSQHATAPPLPKTPHLLAQDNHAPLVVSPQEDKFLTPMHSIPRTEKAPFQHSLAPHPAPGTTHKIDPLNFSHNSHNPPPHELAMTTEPAKSSIPPSPHFSSQPINTTPINHPSSPNLNHSAQMASGDIHISEPHPTSQQQVNRLYNEAMDAMNADHNDQAIQNLTKILAMAPHNKNARVSLAALRIQQNRFNEAESLLITGLKQAPHDPDYTKLYAHILVQKREVPQALTLLERAKPNKVATHTNYFSLMASLYLQQKNYIQAKNLYQRLLKENPLNSTWWAGLGIAYNQLDMTTQAHEALMRANRIGNLSPTLQNYVNSELQQQTL